MMSLSDILGAFPPDLRGPLGQLIETLRDEFRVQRVEFEELKGAVRELAAAQARTEQRVEELAAAQQRTEQRVEELAAAQQRTEQRVEELAAAQQRTTEQLAELAHAQQQTEIALRSLARQVGGLSDTVGGDIEDIAYIVLHDVLGREFGWTVGSLERAWHQWNGEPEEVDIFGTASDPVHPDRRIWIVGEAKHNLTESEARRFVQQAERARAHLTGEVFPVCFCYRVRPEVRELLRKAGIRLVFSYGKLI
jgi:multidrug efflux pump subunit AcrA (membrane-fusion protein)